MSSTIDLLHEMIDLEYFNAQTQRRAEENRRFLSRLKKKDSRKIDEAFHSQHDEVFAHTDCLSCANCCKTTSPIFYQSDVDRAAGALRIKPGEFIEKFLRVDEDGDMVLKSSPCPFLAEDNYCSIYKHRPKACREYPHTDRKKILQITDLTYRNSLICPAVFEIIERLKTTIK